MMTYTQILSEAWASHRLRQGKATHPNLELLVQECQVLKQWQEVDCAGEKPGRNLERMM